MRDADPLCGVCGPEKQDWSTSVCVVIVWIVGRARPYPIFSDEEYRFCRTCRAAIEFVTPAIQGHAQLRGHRWSRAIIVTDDGRGLNLVPGATQPEAQA